MQRWPKKNDWDSFRNSQIRVLKMVSMLRPLRLIGKTSSVRLIIEVWRGWVWCRFVCWSAVEAFSECWVSSQWMPPDQIFNLSVFAFGYWISMISINKYHDYILRLFFCLKLNQFSGQFHNSSESNGCNCYCWGTTPPCRRCLQPFQRSSTWWGRVGADILPIFGEALLLRASSPFVDEILWTVILNHVRSLQLKNGSW